MENPVLVTILLCLLTFFLGWGSCYLTAAKRIEARSSQIAETNAAHGRDIKTLFKERDRTDEKADTAIRLHTEALGLMTEIVNQNNLLIQKVTVEKG